MKKTKIDRSIDTEALGFQVRESYKTARTNIAYSIFKKGCKKVAFTSSTKGEGKTVTSINVASALAQQVGTKVIVVECDLRRPRVNTALKITPTPGLTNYLNEECSLEDIVKDTKIENLKAITALFRRTRQSFFRVNPCLILSKLLKKITTTLFSIHRQSALLLTPCLL